MLDKESKKEKNNNMQKALNKAQEITIYVILFSLPLFLLTIFPNPYGVSKVALLAVGVSLVLLFKALEIFVSGKFSFSVGKFDIAVFVLALSFLVSAILKTPNKMDAFFLPGTATIAVSSALLYFFVNSLEEEKKKTASFVLLMSGLVFSLVILLSYAGIFTKIPQLPAFMKDKNFNTIGGSLPAAIFMGVLLPLGIGTFLRQKEMVNKLFVAVSTIIIGLGLALSIYSSLPGKVTTPRFPGFNNSWQIAVETLKQSPLLGVGPGNYLTAFNEYRPLSYNQTDLWAVRFTSAQDLYLTILTETGFLGVLGLALLFFAIYRILARRIKELSLSTLKDMPELISLVVLLVVFIFFSATTSLFTLLFILLALGYTGKKVHVDLRASSSESSVATRLPAFLVSIPLIVAVCVFYFFSYRAVSAEATFEKALVSLSQNDGKGTYDQMRQAISLNPYVDRYHASYAQVNLALAQNIAQNAQSGNTTLSDQDRQTVAQLIDQAIREGKATVTLNSQRAGNWEVLARIYQSIMAFAQGADNFALQSYSQAVALDPINPNLRISLGGVYYSLGRYDDAIQAFQLAAVAKPDLANAHYNLAAAYREKGDIDKAINEMTNVLSLVDKNSQDYQVAQDELKTLQSQKPQQGELSSGNNLNPPPQNASAIEPKLTLPENSSPPAGTNPSPSPAATPTPTP